MARGGGRLIITSDTLSPRLRTAPARVEAGVVAAMHHERPQTESYARRNAPWTDRTSNARNGLRATTEDRPGYHAIILAHSVAYGIWLEVAHGGAYQIILPTIQVRGPAVMSKLNRLLDRILA